MLLTLLSPLIAEGIARAWYAGTTGDTGYLTFPDGGPFALQRHALYGGPDDGSLRPLNPGWNEVYLRHSIWVNESGFRGRDFGDEPAALHEVVTLGGSSTLSADCPDGSSWPEILEQRLNERHGEGSFAVVNRGMNGWAPSQVADLVEDDIAAREPAALIVYSAFNAIDYAGLRIDLRRGVAPWHTRLLYGRSLYYTLLFHRYLQEQRREAGLSPEGNRDPEQTVRRYRQDLERLAHAASEEGIVVVFVLQALADATALRPELMTTENDARPQDENWDDLVEAFAASQPLHDRLVAEMTAVAEERGLVLIDPRPALLAEPEANFAFALHLLPPGATILADEIDTGLGSYEGGLLGLIGREGASTGP